MKVPAGATTISGQFSHSLKLSLGLRTSSAKAVRGWAAPTEERGRGEVSGYNPSDLRNEVTVRRLRAKYVLLGM